MRHPVFGRPFGRAVLLAAFAVFASGCSEGEEETLAGARAQTETAPAADLWLDVDQQIPPVVFLAQATGAEAAEIGPPLERLAAHYRESPRMIVNRLIQLWGAAHAEDPAMTPARLIADFTPEAQGDAGPMESLGPIVQHYRVLREQGLGHQAAVAAALGKATP